eukprot:g14408.t1
MGFFQRLFGSLFEGTKVKLLLVGLDNSGKTTILNIMKPKKSSMNTVPTVGYSEEVFTKNGVQFSAVDMSGQGKYRNLWESQVEECEGIIFVIDATDKLRFAVAKDELDTLLANQTLQRRPVPMLLFANKMDVPGAAAPLDCMKALTLEQIRDRQWNIFPSDALHNVGIEPGVKWLVEAVKKSRVRGLFPGLGYGALYKISQRSYKFGGQPFVKDLVRKPYERAFGTSDSSGKKANDAVRRALFCDGVAGAIMGAGEVVLLPFDVLKIKAQTNPTYRGRNFLAVFKQEGLRNLYAGWQWTMMRNVPGSFALFGVNAAVREKVFRQQQPPTFLQTAATSTCGSLASILVACPCDVVKTRIQSGRFDGEGRNGFAIARDILREEGVQGFFKGALPKCVAVGPKLIFSFTVAQYLEGYGRQWGEKITYSVGLCYGLGMVTGGFYGSLLGVRKGGATPKLFLNSVMNGVSSRGALLANQGAIMTLYYCVGNQLLGWVRGEDDEFNAPVAGLLSGALYKSTAGSWAQTGRYGLAGGLVFTGIDQLHRPHPVNLKTQLLHATTGEQVQNFLCSLPENSTLAVDLEGHTGRFTRSSPSNSNEGGGSFYPSLVQLYAPGQRQALLVDFVSSGGKQEMLAALQEVFERADVRKIFHDCREDCSLLLNSGIFLKNVGGRNGTDAVLEQKGRTEYLVGQGGEGRTKYLGSLPELLRIYLPELYRDRRWDLVERVGARVHGNYSRSYEETFLCGEWSSGESGGPRGSIDAHLEAAREVEGGQYQNIDDVRWQTPSDDSSSSKPPSALGPWDERPLSREQLHYALEGCLVLPSLATVLQKTLRDSSGDFVARRTKERYLQFATLNRDSIFSDDLTKIVDKRGARPEGLGLFGGELGEDEDVFESSEGRATSERSPDEDRNCENVDASRRVYVDAFVAGKTADGAVHFACNGVAGIGGLSGTGKTTEGNKSRNQFEKYSVGDTLTGVRVVGRNKKGLLLQNELSRPARPLWGCQ